MNQSFFYIYTEMRKKDAQSSTEHSHHTQYLS